MSYKYFTTDVLKSMLSEISSKVSAAVKSHSDLKNNPHSVTADQVGAVKKSGDTMTGILSAGSQTAASGPIRSRGIWGLSNGQPGELYLQYGNTGNGMIYFGTGGKYTISSDGGTYTGTAANAKKVNGHSVNADVPAGASFLSAAVMTSLTLSASGWSDGTYSLETDYPVASYDIHELQPSGTAAQVAAFGAAKIIGSSTSNVLTARGKTPTIDIPVICYVQKK